MITRSKDEDDTIWQDALTMALRRAKWTHEFNTKMNLRKVFRQFFGMPKILQLLTKLVPEPEKLHRRSYDGLRCPHEWPDVFTISAELEHFLHRVSIWCQLRDSVTRAEAKHKGWASPPPVPQINKDSNNIKPHTTNGVVYKSRAVLENGAPESGMFGLRSPGLNILFAFKSLVFWFS